MILIVKKYILSDRICRKTNPERQRLSVFRKNQQMVAKKKKDPQNGKQIKTTEKTDIVLSTSLVRWVVENVKRKREIGGLVKGFLFIFFHRERKGPVVIRNISQIEREERGQERPVRSDINALTFTQ